VSSTKNSALGYAVYTSDELFYSPKPKVSA